MAAAQNRLLKKSLKVPWGWVVSNSARRMEPLQYIAFRISLASRE